jgi:hypothetical protein
MWVILKGHNYFNSLHGQIQSLNWYSPLISQTNCVLILSQKLLNVMLGGVILIPAQLCCNIKVALLLSAWQVNVN